MAQERIEIKFIATGNVALVKAIKELDRATTRLNGELGKLNKVNIKVAQTQDLVSKRVSSNTAAVNANSTAFTRLQATISVYRNKMLLAGFATSLMIRPMVNMVAQAGKFEDLERGFDGLAGSIESSSEFLNKLRKATDGTVDDMQLMQQANNAMMLGIVQSEDEMAQLFDTAQRLGQALGRDTVNSIESLVTGMGRQSRLMLDNLGIIVKSEDAYKKYALANNLSSDALTESQKKIAFNMEAMRQAKGIVNELGIETLSTTQHIAAMQVSTARLTRELGSVLAPVVITISKAMVGIANVIERNSTVLKSLIVVLSAATVSFVAVRIATARSVKMFIVNTAAIATFSAATVTATGTTFSLTGAIAGLTTAMMANPYIRAGAAILAATAAVYAYFKITEDTEEKQKDFNDTVVEAKNVTEDYEKSVQENVNTLQEELDLLNAANDIERMAIKLKRDLTLANYGLHDSELKLFYAIQARKEELKFIKEEEEAEIRRQKDIQKIITETATMHEKAALTRLKANLSLINSEIAIIEAIEESSDETAELEDNLYNLHDAAEKLRGAIADFGKDDDGKNVFGELGETILSTLDGLSDFFGQYAQMSQASAESRISDIEAVANAELNALRNTNKFRRMSAIGQAAAEKKITDKAEKDKARIRKKTNKILAAQFYVDQALGISKAVMNIAEATTEHAGNPFMIGFVQAIGAAQIALMAAQKPPKMERGGYIGGRRHSQGGTLIEAERGEFVMSRDAVESVGLETMNRINQGGGGAINVNFTGNVLSSDFIEEEAIPQIRDAIRRGADIGVG